MGFIRTAPAAPSTWLLTGSPSRSSRAQSAPIHSGSIATARLQVSPRRLRPGLRWDCRLQVDRALLSVRAVPEEHDERRKPRRQRLRLCRGLGVGPVQLRGTVVFESVVATNKRQRGNQLGTALFRLSRTLGQNTRRYGGIQSRRDAKAQFPRRIRHPGTAQWLRTRFKACAWPTHGHWAGIRRWPDATFGRHYTLSMSAGCRSQERRSSVGTHHWQVDRGRLQRRRDAQSLNWAHLGRVDRVSADHQLHGRVYGFDDLRFGECWNRRSDHSAPALLGRRRCVARAAGLCDTLLLLGLVVAYSDQRV